MTARVCGTCLVGCTGQAGCRANVVCGPIRRLARVTCCSALWHQWEHGVTRQGYERQREVLALEPAVRLNAALCERHRRHCPPSAQLARECAQVRRGGPLPAWCLCFLRSGRAQ